MRALEYGSAFAAGAVIYTFVEILWRGYTHPSMTIAGGLCLSLMYMWNGVLDTSPHVLKWTVGALTVTAVEFATGCIVNLWLKQSVWDYSSLKFNLLGQITPLFSLAWFLLSIPGFYLCDIIRAWVKITF